MHHLLQDIGLAVIAATLFGLLAHWLKQPIILGYLIAGALVGPELGRGWIHDPHSIEIMSEIGLILLLFIIGLEMNLSQLMASGKQLLLAGFGQFPICAALGVGVFALLGYGLKGASSDGLYFALMCGLSSTAIVVKLLYDKGELDTLPGRLTLGILVIQDIYAIFVLAFQPNFANPSLGPALKAVGGTAALLAAGFLISRYALKFIFQSISRTPEMVVAVSLGWCAAVAAVAGWMGLSKEMGALVAGVCVSAFPYSIHVTAKTLPLRDSFLALFFLSLGMKIVAPTWAMAGPVLLLIGFTIVSRFLSIYPLLAASGAGRRAAFVASLNLAQISEFSLVIASLGVGFGHIGKGTVAVTIYAMAVMAVMSSYTIRYNHQLYLAFNGLMSRVRPRPAEASDAARKAADREIAILGYHRGARALVEALRREHPELLKRVLVIDFNPTVLEELRAQGIACMFGDISSLDTLKHAHLDHAKVVLSTIPDLLLKGTDNLGLVRLSQAAAPHARIVATADDDRHEQRLRQEGADLVVRPYDLMGHWLAGVVREAVGDTQAKTSDAAQADGALSSATA
jgi:Kef-type K+ transport system membrane component KefB